MCKYFIYFCIIVFWGIEIIDNVLVVLIKKYIYISKRERGEKKMCYVIFWVIIKWLL